MNNDKSTPKKTKRRKYDAEFKREAVDQVLAGRPVSVVAANLGISEGLLYAWRRKRLKTDHLETDPALGDLIRLLRQTEQERDILKKALAIFSREPHV